VAEVLQGRILQNERERKELSGIRKSWPASARRKSSLHNKKLRDCRIHLSDAEEGRPPEESTLFITEGDSASGSITKSRDVKPRPSSA
jgi:topoisomerase-4 subunit B